MGTGDWLKGLFIMKVVNSTTPAGTTWVKPQLVKLGQIKDVAAGNTKASGTAENNNFS